MKRCESLHKKPPLSVEKQPQGHVHRQRSADPAPGKEKKCAETPWNDLATENNTNHRTQVSLTVWGDCFSKWLYETLPVIRHLVNQRQEKCQLNPRFNSLLRHQMESSDSIPQTSLVVPTTTKKTICSAIATTIVTHSLYLHVTHLLNMRYMKRQRQQHHILL